MKLKQLNTTPLDYSEANAQELFKDKKPLEQKMFTWEGWDQHDTASFQFYDCTLIVPMGEFPTGEKFSYISVDYEQSLISLGKDEWAYNHSNDGKSWQVREVYLSMEV